MSENEQFIFDSDDSAMYQTIKEENIFASTSNHNIPESQALESYKASNSLGGIVSDRELGGGVKKVLFSEFFIIVERRDSTPYEKKMHGVVAVCQVCSKRIKGSLHVSSNFIQHLRREHPKEFFLFTNKRGESKEKPGRKNSLVHDFLNFFCDTNSPLSMLKNQSFLKLFPGKSIPSKESIIKYLSEIHLEFVKNIYCELREIEHLSTTTDVWLSENRSFFGYTCHWIDENTFERKCYALACKRFKSCNEFDKVNNLICEINNQYQIPITKILYTITDNGFNYSKAFEEFGVFLIDENEEELDLENDLDSDDLSAQSSPVFISVTPKMTKHFQSATFSLNVLAMVDFTNIIKTSSQKIQELHTDTFNRCTQIWNKCKMFKSSVELTRSTIGTQLPIPYITNWYSIFDAVKMLVKHKQSLNILCHKLETPNFLEHNVKYLEEYMKLMQPIAEAIDFLQNEKNMYFGYFIPTLVSVKVKLRRLESKGSKFLSEFAKKMQEALIHRFQTYFHLESDAWDAVIAAIVIPEVKLKFSKVLLETAKTCTEEDIKNMLNQYAVQFIDATPTEECQQASKSPSSFLDFDEDSTDKSLLSASAKMKNALQETSLYLADNDHDIESLNRHPVIKKMFLKYNTPIPSSAPVQRLLSFTEIVSRSKNQMLNDTNFEMFVLKRANNTFN